MHYPNLTFHGAEVIRLGFNTPLADEITVSASFLRALSASKSTRSLGADTVISSANVTVGGITASQSAS